MDTYRFAEPSEEMFLTMAFSSNGDFRKLVEAYPIILEQEKWYNILLREYVEEKHINLKNALKFLEESRKTIKSPVKRSSLELEKNRAAS